MGNSYTIKLKKGDVEIEVFGPDKEFVSNKFAESILVAFDKSGVFKEAINQLPVQVAEQVAQENASVEVQQEAAVETSQIVEAVPLQQTVEISPVEPVLIAAEQSTVETAEPVVEISQPALVVNETVEAIKEEAAPVQEVVVESIQPVVQEPVQEASVIAPIENVVQEAVQAPQLGKAALASVTQVNEDALSKVYTFKKDGFKANKEVTGTTALKQTSMTKLVLIASEYVNGVAQLSGKALGKHMKNIGTGNLATNLKKDSGIVKEKSFYRLNDAGKQAALALIKDLSSN